MTLTCQQCNKRLSRKTARLIEGRVLCSTCMFTPQKAKEPASAIEARSDETAQQAQPEGRERGGEAETPAT